MNLNFVLASAALALAGCSPSVDSSAGKSAVAANFSCEAAISETGDTVAVKGAFKSPTELATVTTTISTEFGGSLPHYTFHNVKVTDGGATSSINLLKAYEQAGQLDWNDEDAETLDAYNCFNITSNRANADETHICFAKANGTVSPAGFIVSSLTEPEHTYAARHMTCE